MTRLGEKFNVIFFATNFGVTFVELFGLVNLMEKMVDNLVTKLSEPFS